MSIAMGRASEDTFAARLQNILRVANGLKEVTISHSSTHSSFGTTPSPVVVDSITLPIPPPLRSSLLEAGASHEIADSANAIYQLRAEELRKNIQASIVTVSHKIAALPTVASASSPDSLINKVVSTATEIYLQRLGQWREVITERVKHTSAGIPAPRNGRPFNHQYVPLLERYFEENPFPTHADKVFLAKKSKMEYKQIHVWFQNRRSRTKKEGKVLKKKSTHERAMSSLEGLYGCMKGREVDSGSRVFNPSKVGCSKGKTKSEPMQNATSKDPFDSPPPSHAFPSFYPPTCDYDPFPCKSGPSHFSKPDWRSVPDGKLPNSLSISIDDLVEKFSHLSVRDGGRSKGASKLQSHAATVAITVIPSPAPLPSLIACKYSHPINTLQLRSSVCAPVSHSKAFQSSSSKPVTLVPLSPPRNKNELIGKRKIASLPRCSPGRQHNARRDTTPSENSSTSSSSPRLFSTDSESTHSSSVSPLSTPPDAASVQELPHLFGSPPCRSSFNSPVHLRSLGNPVPISS